MKFKHTVPRLVIDASKKLPELLKLIIREAKPDSITIDPKTKALTLNYKKEI